jgi:hypothetical protein
MFHQLIAFDADTILSTAVQPPAILAPVLLSHPELPRSFRKLAHITHTSLDCFFHNLPHKSQVERGIRETTAQISSLCFFLPFAFIFFRCMGNRSEDSDFCK